MSLSPCWLIVPPGLSPYAPVATEMAHLAAQRGEGSIPDTLLLVEHQPVFTTGRRSDPAHAVWTEAQMRTAGADVADADRGGSTTFHGPGQLVGYPILDLGSRREIAPYLRRLEEVIIRASADVGVAVTRSDRQTGVWAGDAKVCAIGVRVTHRTITLHGFGLNCDTDLSWFDGIVPCGLADARVTSLSALAQEPISVELMRPRIEHHFADVFKCALQDAPPTTLAVFTHASSRAVAAGA